jgi:cytochrome oxidase assembly protein ShyY1
MNAERRRGGLAGPLAITLVMLVVLLGLGTWQLQRKSWKEALIATLDRRLNDAPIALPPPSEWAGMTAQNSEFTRVRLHVEFRGAGDALVFAGASSIRDDVKGVGYFVFSPARLPDGKQVAVNRGFTPERSYPAAAGQQDIVGYLRWPESPSWFAAAHDTAGEIWTVRDPKAMAALKHWGPVAPFYIEQESPVPPGGVPHPAPLKVHLRNEHLQYAITWYGLAAALMAVFAIWAARRRREMAG